MKTCPYTDFCLVPLVEAHLTQKNDEKDAVFGTIIKHMAFRHDWLSRKGNPDKMVLIRSHGDSMEPYIRNGDLVLVDESRKEIIPHAIYAVGIDDGIYITKMETLPGQRIRLVSFNRQYVPIDIYRGDDLADSVRIIGKVLWWCHEE